MGKKEFISEHKSLIKTLRGKNKKKQLIEADEQERELRKYLSK
jgi:hypothetical protein